MPLQLPSTGDARVGGKACICKRSGPDVGTKERYNPFCKWPAVRLGGCPTSPMDSHANGGGGGEHRTAARPLAKVVSWALQRGLAR